MLTGLTRAVRTSVAMGFVALYALCILAPTAALAFSGDSCLEHELAPAHSHASDAAHGGAHHHGEAHDHAGAADTPSEDHAGSKCCGMLFCSALAPELALALAPALLSGRTAFAAMQDFTGLPPDKLIRPPKSQS